MNEWLSVRLCRVDTRCLLLYGTLERRSLPLDQPTQIIRTKSGNGSQASEIRGITTAAAIHSNAAGQEVLG